VFNGGMCVDGVYKPPCKGHNVRTHARQDATSSSFNT
jgi:hypothetical protein